MSTDVPSEPPAIEMQAPNPAGHKVIGVAHMEPDGTIAMQLRIEDPAGGAVGHSHPRYTPGSPDYDAILRHLGAFKPGETKAVYDDWE